MTDPRPGRSVPASSTAPQLILAFDFGTRRMGVASGDTLTRTARPLTTLNVAAGTPWQEVDRLVGDFQPARLIVGLPYNMDGTPTNLTDAARAFGKALAARYSLEVLLIDERLSSREAEGQLRDARAAGLKHRRLTHADVDMTAAKILLERWFDAPDSAEKIA